MCVLLRRQLRQIRVEIRVETIFCELGLGKVGETLLVESVLKLLEAENEVENLGLCVLGSSGADYTGAGKVSVWLYLGL